MSMMHLFNTMAPRSAEQEILLSRFVLGLFAALSTAYIFNEKAIIFAFLGYIAAHMALYFMRRSNVGKNEFRWTAAILLDVSITITLMARAPGTLAVVYPLFLWMILSNGFRFGSKFLLISSLIATVGFGSHVATTEFWADKRGLGLSLTLALLVIPAYCSTLIGKLTKARAAAEAANKAKSYFLASISHELRTPLNAIIGYGNHLQHQDLPQRHRDMVNSSVLAGEHLLQLVDQLIEIARADRGKIVTKYQVVRPTDLLSEIRSIMAVRAGEKGLELRLHAAPLSDAYFNAPAESIRNILLNLVGNAIKFTESGFVVVSCQIVQSVNGATLELRVSDTGIGIADEAQGHIFKPFQQADQTVLNRFGGTGLGLAICRQFCDQVGGSMTVESALGQGSCFTVQIPVQHVREEAQNSDPQIDTAVRIVAIGSFDLDLLAKTQSAGNYMVKSMPCGHAAEIPNLLDQCDLTNFDIAVIDQRLADQIAPEAACWARFAEAKVATVMVAADEDINLEEIWLRASFASIIPPAPSFDELRSAIRIGQSFAKIPNFPKKEEEQGPKTYAPRSVLVADDNRTNRNILSAILETAGHSVTLVCDGDETLEALEKDNFDIVLLDVNMPRINGIDACRTWRESEGSDRYTPIIGVTADATAETEELCLAAGMDLRLTKPVNAKLLLDTIDRYCSKNAEVVSHQPYIDQPPANVVEMKPGVSTDGLQSLDLAQIDYLSSIGGDSFVAEMIDGFNADVSESLLAFQTAVDAKDIEKFKYAAHAFKSCSNNIGAALLADMCGKLERISELEFDDNASTHFAAVETELANVLLLIDGLRNSSDLPATARSA
jgi:two-component system, sensor histidine kinase RpfC